MRRNLPRTWLYVPAVRSELLPKALVAGADVVIIDLEDAVAAEAKADARESAIEFLDRTAAAGDGGSRTSVPPIQLRVNPIHTEVGRADLRRLAGHPAIAGIRLSKVESADDVEHARQLLGGTAAPGLSCLIETARGIEQASSIAEATGVSSISLGEADLAAELGLAGEKSLTWARSRIVIAAAAAGLPPPSMSVYPDLRDDDGLAASCRLGRDLGLWGRAAVHPRQLPIIRRVFIPNPTDVIKARRLLASADGDDFTGAAAFQLPDGRFVDRAVIAAAQRTVELADELQSDSREGNDRDAEGIV